MKTPKKNYKAKKLIRNILNDCGFPKSKRFLVKNKNGVLVVRFHKNKYE